MNLLSFPFYGAKTEQSRYQGCGSVVRALPSAQNRWLPFVLEVPATGDGLDCVKIRRASDDIVYKTVSSTSFSYNAYTDGGKDYIFYYGGVVAALNMPCDDYYLEAKGLFSEVFSVVRNLDKYLKLEWKNKAGLYQTGFSNVLYLDAVIAEPTYAIEEEGEEDAAGNFVALRTRVEKTLKLDTLLLPEFLVDALAGIALHDERSIGRYRDVHNLKVAPTWNGVGCAASVALTFAAGTPHTSEGCGDNVPFSAIDLSGYDPGPCDGTGPIWQDVSGATRCELNEANATTGWLEKQQKNTNPLSPTFNATRWVRTTYNTTTCPLLKRSREITDIVYRTDCEPNQTAGYVEYTVRAGHFTGYNQAYIDGLAQEYFDNTKAAYANTNATCEDEPEEPVYLPVYTYSGCFACLMQQQDNPNIIRNATGEEVVQYTVYQGTDGNLCVSCQQH